MGLLASNHLFVLLSLRNLRFKKVLVALELRLELSDLLALLKDLGRLLLRLLLRLVHLHLVLIDDGLRALAANR